MHKQSLLRKMEKYEVPFESQPIEEGLKILRGKTRVLENNGKCYEKKKQVKNTFGNLLRTFERLADKELENNDSVEVEVIIAKIQPHLTIYKSSAEERDTYLQQFRFQIQDNFWGIVILNIIFLIDSKTVNTSPPIYSGCFHSGGKREREKFFPFFTMNSEVKIFFQFFLNELTN